jgi:hypothetical protein
VKQKLGGLLVTLVFLAGCGQSASSGYSPASSASAVRTSPNAAAGPTFTIAVELPESRPAAAAGATVMSLKWSVYVKQKRYVGEADTFPCPMSEAKGVIGGCEVAPSPGTASFVIRKSTFTLYSATGGKGCVLGTGTFKGTTEPPEALGMTLKAENLKTCWSH